MSTPRLALYAFAVAVVLIPWSIYQIRRSRP